VEAASWGVFAHLHLDSLSLASRSLVVMVHLHVFGNLALELGSIEIVFGKFLYT
jgi:hypothetical protein